MMNKCIVFLVMIALLINGCTPIPAAQQEFTTALMPAPTSIETPMPVTPTHARSYTSERFGVSFDLPSGWEEVGEDHFAGTDGFVQIEPFESIANTTLRVCDWEMNLHPERYGNLPRADIIGPEPFIEQPPCKIIPLTMLPIRSSIFFSSHPTITKSAVILSCVTIRTRGR